MQKTYQYKPKIKRVRFKKGVNILKERGYHVVCKAIDNTSTETIRKILSDVKKTSLSIVDYQINADDYIRFVRNVGYKTVYHKYYPENRYEKTLEHYIVCDLLKIKTEDIFIDVASEESPLSEIVEKLTGAVCYNQDIEYPEGIDGSCIGGDACAMPVEDGFASKIALTCSLEHFENDSDIRLFKELARILRVGGIVCVIPLYLYTENAVQTDPAISVPAEVMFDENDTLYCAKKWKNRHGRFYNPLTFFNRIVASGKEQFRFRLYYLKNTAEVDASVYARFALTATRI